jgi:aerobic carbon-monoxide dehydrogenase large subunit
MAAIAAERYTGASIKRSEDPRILTGAGRYVDDIKLPGMLHAAFVRSPLAHARVVSVDVSAARALPGVVAAFTGADLEAMTVPGPDALMALMGWAGPTPEFTLLATDKVRFAGDPVAIVVAESRYLAEDGCELVDVEYDELPPVTTASFALDPSSPPLFVNLGDNIARAHSRSEFGDVAATFADADRVIDVRIDVHRHQNVPMEGRGCVASYDAELGVMTVYASTQSVHVTKIAVAMRLGMEHDKVRVVAGDIGGSFGLKIGASREELAIAGASRAVGRPVKWVEDRGENLTASGQAREESFDVRAAVSDDGDLLGLDVKVVVDTGSYPGMGAMVPAIMEAMLPGPYKVAALGFESTAVTTNKASYVAYRGPWASETFVRERVLDLIAKDLGLDPLKIRLRNVAARSDPPAVMITGRPLVGVTTRESLERLAQVVDFPAFRRRQAEARARGRSRPALARRAQRPDGHRVHARPAGGRRRGRAVHRPDAARPEPPDDPGPDRRRRVRRAVRAGPRRRRRHRRGPVRADRRQPVGHHDRGRGPARRPAAQGQGAGFRVASHGSQRSGPPDHRRPGLGAR